MKCTITIAKQNRGCTKRIPIADYKVLVPVSVQVSNNQRKWPRAGGVIRSGEAGFGGSACDRDVDRVRRGPVGRLQRQKVVDDLTRRETAGKGGVDGVPPHARRRVEREVAVCTRKRCRRLKDIL